MTDVIEARRTDLVGDLDLVEFSSMSPSEHAGAYFGLLEELENLFARRVGPVEIGAVRNPYLRREIEEHQATLSGALGGPLTQNW